MSEKESKPAFGEQAKAIDNDNYKAETKKNQAKEPRRINTFIGPADEIIDLTQADNEPPEIDMIRPGFIKGTVAALIGPSGVGKSYWILQESIKLAYIRQEKVIYINAEDHKDVLKHRIHNLFKHLDNNQKRLVIENLIVISKRSFNIMNDLVKKSIIDYCKGALLVIFDTLSKIHKLNENDNIDMSTLIERLQLIADETGAGVLFLHHMAKSAIINDYTTDQSAARGASALINSVRYAGYLTLLSKKELKNNSISEDNANRYIKYGVSKQSFGEIEPEQYYERMTGGLLKLTNINEIKKGGYYDSKKEKSI